MKKVKTGIWVAIVAFVAILIYQNHPFFWKGQSLRLNLLFAEYQSPEWKILMICTGFFVAGLILGMYLLLIYHLRLKRKKKIQQAPAEQPQEQAAAGEPATRPEPSAPRGSNAETVVITPEVTPPVTERQES